MTNAEYITQITGGTATLVRNLGLEAHESSLGADEYFVLIVCTEYQSYLRNYREYKGSSNYNESSEVYDIDLARDYGNQIMISKTYRTICNSDRGRVIIINVPITTNYLII